MDLAVVIGIKKYIVLTRDEGMNKVRKSVFKYAPLSSLHVPFLLREYIERPRLLQASSKYQESCSTASIRNLPADVN